jgi:6-pyruvoyltetrahydropterin/6-carboxytetrahydropterin synthase
MTTTAPIVELSRSLTFSAAHRLTNVPASHPCGRDHGHNDTLTLFYSGPVDAAQGWVFDTKLIDEVLMVFKDTLDHQHLNKLGFPFSSNPTAENLILWAWSLAASAVPTGEFLVRVELSETGKGRFIHRGQGGPRNPHEVVREILSSGVKGEDNAE